MSTFSSVDEALQFAIDREQEAADFYSSLAGRAKAPGMKDVFMGFAAQETGHKNKLLAVKQGGDLQPAAQKVVDLQVSDYLAEVSPSDDMDLQAALTLAMQREKKAFKLYSDLAAAATSENLRQTFLALAQEEAGHKVQLEIIYDDQILTDN